MDNSKNSLGSAIATLLLVSACGGSDSGPEAGMSLNDDASAVVDPAPAFDMPGSYGCEGCPDSTISQFEFTTIDSALTFADVISDSVGNGEYYIAGSDGSAIGGVIPTSFNGAFAVELPLFCGRQIIKCIWSNETGSYVLVTEVQRDDCTNADIQLTLNWDDLGQDYELHLLKPGGTINDNLTDCTWTSCIGKGPDWGIVGDTSDDPLKDVDNTGAYGPENIILSSPEEGEYVVLVEHWGAGDPESDGNVIFNVAGETTIANVTDFPTRHVWNVGTILWPSGEVILNGEIIDCSENWSNGCRLGLPERSFE